MMNVSLFLVSIIMQVPNRIEKLVQEKQFYAAVQLHVQSTLMLEREGLQMVCIYFIFCLLPRRYISLEAKLFNWWSSNFLIKKPNLGN